ncbi:myeloid protein 1-like isoform X2 [Centropristis striata]|uniref:myeloid protein 1-like isoform X2 n=1 Tax=Centropristis striata TaxID=184440 RepID=UPI0027E031FD|nr:myeloid protein 1-like isoform X2 [Centropristis striata]
MRRVVILLGNPSNSIRTSDVWGEGHYGAPRGTREHKGLDIECNDGSVVYAPFDVTINRSLSVFSDPKQAAINNGIQLSGNNLCFKLFPLKPDQVSGTVKGGQRLGVMMPMQSVYPGIISHIHIQMCDDSDPTPYLKCALCEGNPLNSRRTNDSWGDGIYGAPRGTREHNGLDIECNDGSVVYAPFDVTVNGSLSVFSDPKQEAINNGIQLSGNNLCFKLFYVQPDRVSGTVKRGERLGVMMPMQSVYPGITSYIHVQMCDESDPSDHF